MSLPDADLDRIAELVTDRILHAEITVPDDHQSTVNLGALLGGPHNDLHILRTFTDDLRRTLGA